MFLSTFTLLASAAFVAGHGIVDTVKIGGVVYPGTKNYETPLNDKSPVRGLPSGWGYVDYRKVNTPDIACSSAGLKPRKLAPEVTAGGQVGVRWGGAGGPDSKQWPHAQGSILAYMASCEGKCSEFDPSNAKFFKIYEEGLDGTKQPIKVGNHTPVGQGLWAQNRIQFENSWSYVTIPADIKAGEYLLRHELISLHAAASAADGAQYYPVCIQVKVTGGGSASPATTLVTKLYTEADGIVDIYQPYNKGGIAASSYKLPGPPLYVANNAATGQLKNSTTPVTTQAAVPAATSARPSSAPVTTQTIEASAATSQCGGVRNARKRGDEASSVVARAHSKRRISYY
ncbi:glycosyl hydrolase family 61-domain-containing protein [Rhizoctonia solani]|nr:glycosyl hydrolase family 61-domain-containing protein [Rhizoctonia solani]